MIKRSVLIGNSPLIELAKSSLGFTHQFHNGKVLGYRVIEALRNYVQHRGVPVHNIVFSYQLIEENEHSRLLHHVVPRVKVSVLESDKKFKSSVANELKSIAIKDEVDIRLFIREYVESIGKIHEWIRSNLKSDIQQWESLFEDAISQYQSEFGENISLVGLAIVIEDETGYWVEKKTIFKEFLERRKSLERKNYSSNNLSKCYASNEIWEKSN